MRLGARASVLAVAVWAGLTADPEVVRAGGTYVDPKKECFECHKPEFAVWEQSTHAKGFNAFHRQNRDLIAKIMKATGSKARSIREDATCIKCHYTANPGQRPVASISCERCHGPSGPPESGWLRQHSNYGEGVSQRDQESPPHRAERIKKSKQLGMIRSEGLYDIAANCMECHGLAHPEVDTGALAAMLEAGHPLNHEYELVKYSQGEVRHRFYPVQQPVGSPNPKTPPDDLARLYAIGQAAKLVSAAAALKTAKDETYKKEQQKRLAQAKEKLQAIPAASGLFAGPTEANARAFWDKIQNADLQGSVGKFLPPESAYVHSDKYK